MAKPEGLWARWVYAAKPGSWPKLLVPMLLGQAMGVAAYGALRVEAIVVGAAFTVFDLLYIVFLNDFFDRRVDAVKREMFPQGCSPKTIPDGILPAGALLAAGVASGLAVLAVAGYAELVLGRPHLLLGGVGALLIFAIYSAPPFASTTAAAGSGWRCSASAPSCPFLTPTSWPTSTIEWPWRYCPGFVP